MLRSNSVYEVEVDYVDIITGKGGFCAGKLYDLYPNDRIVLTVYVFI